MVYVDNEVSVGPCANGVSVNSTVIDIISGSFPVCATDSLTGTSPEGPGTYDIDVVIIGYISGCYIVLTDSNFIEHCQNLTGNGTYTFTNIYTAVSSPVFILLSDGVCPSPTPSVTPSLTPSLSVSRTRTPSITPSLSISSTRTPSITPSRTMSITPSLTPSLSISSTRTPSITPSRTMSITPSLSISSSRTPSITTSRTTSITPSLSLSGTPGSSRTPSVSVSSSPGNPFSSGLLGCWNFDDYAAPYQDTSGNNNHWTFASAESPLQEGKIGYSVRLPINHESQFDPDSSLLQITGDTTTFELNNMTISTWIKISGYTTYQRTIFYKYSTTVELDYGRANWLSIGGSIEGTAGRVRFTIIDNDQVEYTTFSNGVVNNNQWRHIAVTMGWTGSTDFAIKVYIDGTLDSAYPQYLNVEEYGWDVGKNGLTCGNMWLDANVGLRGYIDASAIWNRVLTADEISTMYNIGFGQACTAISPTPSLSRTPTPTATYNPIIYYDVRRYNCSDSECGGTYADMVIANHSAGSLTTGNYYSNYDSTYAYLILNVSAETTGYDTYWTGGGTTSCDEHCAAA